MGNCCSPGCRLWCLWWYLFVLSFFPRGVLDEILNLIESVSEGFPSYSYLHKLLFVFISSSLLPYNNNLSIIELTLSRWYGILWIYNNLGSRKLRRFQGWMTWMTCDFTSFLTVFQSYQDDVWMIMKGCVQWNSVYGWEDFTSSEDRTRSARSVGQRLTHWATGAPFSRKECLNWII